MNPPGTGVTRLRVMKRSHGSADSGRKDYKQESDHGSQSSVGRIGLGEHREKDIYWSQEVKARLGACLPVGTQGKEEVRMILWVGNYIWEN